MSFTFTDLFIELKREVGKRLDSPGLFMMSLTCKSLHTLFKQSQLKAEQVPLDQPPKPQDLLAFQSTPYSAQALTQNGIPRHFLNMFQTHRTVLSTQQRVLLECIVEKDYPAIWEFLFGPCDWVLNMAALTELALTLVRRVLINMKHVHGYVQFKAHPNLLTVSCGSVDSIISAADFAKAIGESGSHELIVHVNKHHELILPVLGKSHHLNFLEGLLVHDNLDMFRSCVPVKMASESSAGNEWSQFHAAFARYGAVQCLDFYLAYLLQVADTPAANGTSDPWHILRSCVKVISSRQILEPGDYVLFDILLSHLPDGFNIRELSYGLCDRSHMIPLIEYILKKHPAPLAHLSDLASFMEWLTQSHGFPYHRRIEHLGQYWYPTVSPFLPKEYQEYVNDVSAPGR